MHLLRGSMPLRYSSAMTAPTSRLRALSERKRHLRDGFDAIVYRCVSNAGEHNCERATSDLKRVTHAVASRRVILERNAESLRHPVQRAAIDPKCIGGARPIAADRLQYVQHVAPFEFVER